MKSTPDGSLLAVLQSTVSTTLKQWLDDNKAEFLGVAREAMLENERTKREQQHTRGGEFLTVGELALRWHLNPETVRRMIRDGRIPSVLAGRHHRVAAATIAAFETSGSLPRR
jgi:excisionase family DNA binding protein